MKKKNFGENKEFKNKNEENSELCLKRRGESMAEEKFKFVWMPDFLEEDSEEIFDDYYREDMEDNENSEKPFGVIEDEYSEDMPDDCVENRANIEDNMKPSDDPDELMILWISIQKIL